MIFQLFFFSLKTKEKVAFLLLKVLFENIGRKLNFLHWDFQSWVLHQFRLDLLLVRNFLEGSFSFLERFLDKFRTGIYFLENMG
jgi:hypothetical protein